MKRVIYYLSFLISYIVAHDCDIFVPIPPPITSTIPSLITTTPPITSTISPRSRPTLRIIINPRPELNVTVSQFIQTRTQFQSKSQEVQTNTQDLTPSKTPTKIPEIPEIPETPPIPTPTQTPIITPPTPTPEIDTNIVTYKLKSTDISDMLKTHNDERAITNLNNLSWDVNLQSSSELWSRELAAKNCALEHKLFSSAQNLYGGYGWLEPNFKDAIQLWINEKNILNQPNITFHDVGHYLIIVSESYSQVGCGAALNIANNCFVVTCNYN